MNVSLTSKPEITGSRKIFPRQHEDETLRGPENQEHVTPDSAIINQISLL